MKKTLLSLTAAALLCTALPQQTLAGCFGNSKRSDDIEMTTYGNYKSVHTYDGESEPPNTCSQLLSNAGHTASSAWSDLMQSRACDKTWKKALWITGGIVVGGLVISGYWWVPAVATAVAPTASTTLAPFSGQNDSAVPAGNGIPAPSFDCTKAPKLSQCLIEDAIEELQQNGSLSLEIAQDLTAEEVSAIMVRSQEWSDDSQSKEIKIVSEGQSCAVSDPRVWDFCIKELSQPETEKDDSTHCQSSFNINLRLQPMSQMQSQAIQKAADMWQKIITGHESGRDIRLTIDVKEGYLNQDYANPGGTLGAAGIERCYQNTAATQSGSITLDDLKQQSFSDYWNGGTPFSTAAHEIGHLLLPLAKIPGPFQVLPNGQQIPANPLTACQTSHYFQSGNGRGDDLFTGPKTIAYFQKLATQRDLDPSRFNAGVPISGGHPSSNTIDQLAHESGFFGNPSGTPLEEYILHMLEDVGYCIDWNAAKPYMHQNNAQSAW
ncbi:MAG: hypothetical protein V6Z78_01855 [Holosporaceae bacterium]